MVLHRFVSVPIEDGVVLIEDGKHRRKVGPGLAGARYPTGVEVLEAEVVTPGLVDVHSVVGLAGIYNSSDRGQVQDQDQIEKLRARSSPSCARSMPTMRSSRWSSGRATFGVTTVHTGHGPGVR